MMQMMHSCSVQSLPLWQGRSRNSPDRSGRMCVDCWYMRPWNESSALRMQRTHKHHDPFTSLFSHARKIHQSKARNEPNNIVDFCLSCGVFTLSLVYDFLPIVCCILLIYCRLVSLLFVKHSLLLSYMILVPNLNLDGETFELEMVSCQIIVIKCK